MAQTAPASASSEVTGGAPGAPFAAGPAATAPGDFELLPPERVVDPALTLKLDQEVARRRSLLQWHQALGIATVVLMAGTVITGQLDYTDRFGGGTSTGNYEAWHTTFEGVTTISFLADGILALVAPVPFPKSDSGSIFIHKISMLVATAGFAAEVPLGIYTVAREGHVNQASFALVHLILGYVTGAAVATGAGILAL